MTNGYPTSAGQRSQGALTVDNVFRRMLKVANPRDPDEVAKALLARYSDDAQKIKREQAGVPISSYQLAQLAGQASGPLSSEIRQATDDLERDLGALVSDIQLKDIAPELRGLSEAVRDAATKGLEAAKFALDPAQRDRAFAARRTLGDYARLTRLLGALTACATALYCRVSQSTDMCANLILVSAGEALAAAGVTKSGGLLQVPAVELQSRRDAIIGALHRLLGTEDDVVVALGNVLNQQSTGPAAGSAGALARIARKLEENGEQDLRALLDQGFVTNLLDGLLDRAIATTPESLRSMASTAVITSGVLQRFVSLVGPLVGMATDDDDDDDDDDDNDNGGNNGIPPLEHTLISDYVTTLASFSAGFQSTQVGYRLPFLARPPLLGYGFYGAGGIDAGTTALQTLAVRRSQIAELVDCLCCACTENSAVAAAIAAKLLFDLDRSIDLFCLGENPGAQGLAELHAAAYNYVFEAATKATFNRNASPNTNPWTPETTTNLANTVLGKALPALIESKGPLAEVIEVLRRRQPGNVDVLTSAGGGWGTQAISDPTAVRDRLVRVLEAQLKDEERWRRLALSWSPICDQKAIVAPGKPIDQTGVGFILTHALDKLIPVLR